MLTNICGCNDECCTYRLDNECVEAFGLCPHHTARLQLDLSKPLRVTDFVDCENGGMLVDAVSYSHPRLAVQISNATEIIETGLKHIAKMHKLKPQFREKHVIEHNRRALEVGRALADMLCNSGFNKRCEQCGRACDAPCFDAADHGRLCGACWSLLLHSNRPHD